MIMGVAPAWNDATLKIHSTARMQRISLSGKGACSIYHFAKSPINNPGTLFCIIPTGILRPYKSYTAQTSCTDNIFLRSDLPSYKFTIALKYKEGYIGAYFIDDISLRDVVIHYYHHFNDGLLKPVPRGCQYNLLETAYRLFIWIQVSSVRTKVDVC